MEFRCLARSALLPLSSRALAVRRFSYSRPPRAPADTDAPAPPPAASTPPQQIPSIPDILGLFPHGPTPTRNPKSSSLGSSSPFSSILSPDLGRSLSPKAPPLSARPTPRTGPSAGRTVLVVSDLPQALTRLRGILSANSVKIDQLRQRFHERPGKKKKRLKSLRHRKRFKEGFKRLVTIAMEMKRKGL